MVKNVLHFRSTEGFRGTLRFQRITRYGREIIKHVKHTRKCKCKCCCWYLFYKWEHCYSRDVCRGDYSKIPILPSVSGFHTCCECKKTYRSRMALNRHVREECGRILYTCPYCHNIMPMKFNLLNHLKKEHGC